MSDVTDAAISLEGVDAPARILAVDDEPSVLRSVARLLKLNGFECATAGSAAEAREQLSQETFALILSDVDMPGESGLDLLESVSVTYPDTATVMVTGIDDREVAERAIKMGAYGYVIKPFEANEILISVSNALRRRDLELENRMHRERLEEMVQQRTSHLWTALRELEQTQEHLRQSHEKTIEKLALTAEYRDVETAEHIHRMSRYCEILARQSGLDEEQAHLMRIASVMHDVGKIGIPDGILLKPGPLTPDEFEIMKSHAEIGHRILTDPTSPLLDLAATIALTHHEWYDGSGYPNGLAGESIPKEGRIAGIADVFDALTSNRVYRRAFHLGEAVEMMQAERGTHFDPDLLDLFLEGMDQLVGIRDEGVPARSPS